MEFLKSNYTNAILDQLDHHVEYIHHHHVSIPTIIGALLFLCFLYWLFYTPYNWKRRIDEVGYGPVVKGISSSKRKRDAINHVRRMRRKGVGELPPPFPNGWYCIMMSSELKQGMAKSVACLGEQFVVYRTLANDVHIMDAYCPHLGANLGMGGRVVGDSIECPFHLWRFSGSDGKCNNIPYSNCATPTTAKLRKWISREANEGIFVWYSAENDEHPWNLPIIKEIDNHDYVYHGCNEFYVNCHIQEIPENGADIQHFVAIHNASLLAGCNEPNTSALANTGIHHWQAVWNPGSSPNKHLAAITLSHSIELTRNWHVFNMDVVGEQIGPAYVQLHMNSPTFGRFEIIQTIVPIEPLLQKVIHRFYAPRIMGPIMKFAVIGESIMFERDMAMWNHKKFCNKPQLVKEDALIKSFRNWFSQFYSVNSKTFTEAHNSLEW